MAPFYTVQDEHHLQIAMEGAALHDFSKTVMSNVETQSRWLRSCAHVLVSDPRNVCLKVLTHNLMIFWLSSEVFYQSRPEPISLSAENPFANRRAAGIIPASRRMWSQ